MSQGSSVYLSALNAMGTALATATALRDVGRDVTIVVPRRLRQAAEQSCGGFPVADTGPDTPRLDRMHDELAFHLSALSPGANPDNAVLRLGLETVSPGILRELKAAVRRTWKLRVARLPNPTANRLIKRTMQSLVQNVFPSRHVVAISFPARGHLLCARSLLVDTVLDSWDHPVRKCAGYVTRSVVGWNRELAWEWRDFQGAEQVIVGYPVRLGYALQRTRPDVGATLKRVIMYPIATTSHVRSWFRDEMLFLRQLADRTHAAGWKLLVKPKPMSTREEIPDFISGHPAVRLGHFESSAGALDYALDDDVNRRRIAELDAVDLVVNTVTTFGLDAAAAGVPLLQLDLRACSAYPSLASAARNRHLHRYLYRAWAVEPGEHLAALGPLLADPEALMARAKRTSSDLRRWLTADAVTADQTKMMRGAAEAMVRSLQRAQGAEP